MRKEQKIFALVEILVQKLFIIRRTLVRRIIINIYMYNIYAKVNKIEKIIILYYIVYL